MYKILFTQISDVSRYKTYDNNYDYGELINYNIKIVLRFISIESFGKTS